MNAHAASYRDTVLATIAAAVACAAAGSLTLAGQEPASREFSVTAGNYAYQPGRLEVKQDDLVKVRFHSTDMPHSFTVDAYRIAKRAGAGQTVVFEFRADQPGTFPIYCNLTTDKKCREMHGEIVVRAK